MDLDNFLCYCFHIKKRKIVNFVKQTRPKRASQISDCFGAGTGCGWCVPFLRKIHQQIVAGEAIEADDISAEEYEAMRADYRREVSEGSRQRNTHGMTSLPPELDGRIEVEFRSAPEPTPKQSEDDDWDVSDYFSRERPPEPEPDTLE